MPYKKPHHTSDGSFKNENGVFVIEPKGLNIVWGNDSRYWKIPDQNGAAELIQVSWLEVSGVVKVKSGDKYKVQFELKVKEDGFGWTGTDVLVMAKAGKKGRYLYTVVKLSPGMSLTSTDPLEVPMGPETDLHFGLYEVWSGKWKGGLEIHKAIVSPA